MVLGTYGLGRGIRLRGGAFGTLADFPFFPAMNNTGITYIHTYVCLVIMFFRLTAQYEIRKRTTQFPNFCEPPCDFDPYLKLELCTCVFR